MCQWFGYLSPFWDYAAYLARERSIDCYESRRKVRVMSRVIRIESHTQARESYIYWRFTKGTRRSKMVMARSRSLESDAKLDHTAVKSCSCAYSCAGRPRFFLFGVPHSRGTDVRSHREENDHRSISVCGRYGLSCRRKHTARSPLESSILYPSRRGCPQRPLGADTQIFRARSIVTLAF